ncbi:rRNA-processing protein fcf2-like [Cucurbita pepo subsp. pepo]|uniref:rRNA-processing protein fcf2-like n=1 Tax=Cucurbita pepo subsp. pepo TaxID=3664 RepID=UPI000C9D6389|nr:rRNA-processing protein fcf2-like [Cucurbita pepo subsp. pepo]XP_023540916.1 rRNA-processing protein fcf2-like [Cucurbita pepo subsp. pepo]
MSEIKPIIGLSWEPNLPTSSLGIKTKACDNSHSQAENSLVWKINSELVDGLFVPPNNPKKLNNLLRKQVSDTAGRSWFDMAAQTMTPEVEEDLRLLKLRSVIDPKRHYKKGDSKSKTLPKYFQVGTVVESSLDFFSGRLTKKERKATLADELLSDQALTQYRKRKVQEIEEQNRSAGNDKWKIKGRHSRKRSKERRK